MFGIPDYQMDAVAQYKNSPDANLPLRRFWNDTGRGFPDVAALGGRKVGYCICAYDRYGDGKWQHVSGTSASAPVVAGVFARLKGLRLAAGLPPLGFLNPFIYRNPSGFHCEARPTARRIELDFLYPPYLPQAFKNIRKHPKSV